MNKLQHLLTYSKRHFSSINSKALSIVESLDTFPKRHNHQPDSKVDASGSAKISQMLKTLEVNSLEELIRKTVPASIYQPEIISKLDNLFVHKTSGDHIDGESDVLREFYEEYASLNKKFKNFIGMGYYGTKTPTVILRNVLENPGWYTQYTPYQAEISQGRLESLLNYQTMIADMTGLPISNASLLDEGTSAAEAMVMCYNVWSSKTKLKDSQVNQIPCRFFVSSDVHPQTISLLRTRAEPKKIQVIVADASQVDVAKLMSSSEIPFFGAMVQYPNTDGQIRDYSQFTSQVHQQGGLVVAATDLLALTLIKTPGELGIDIAVGTNQRFGIPMGYGGPHAGFLATKDEFKRIIPGRLIGVSKDIHGNRALRMALQTREQHIRRDKATSNICTAQALLSNISAFYAIYHGPEGLKKIATNVHEKTVFLANALRQMGYTIFGNENALFFDTIRIDLDHPEQTKSIKRVAESYDCNFRYLPNGKSIGISFDETTTAEDIRTVLSVFSQAATSEVDASSVLSANNNIISQSSFQRQTKFLQQEVFNSMHTEHDLLRYIFKLQSRDISLAHSMIPLGSCTMKLNSTSEMIPITWSEFGNVHPFAPVEQTEGYQKMFRDLETWLAMITGFDAVSLQPNAGSQGEYAGLLAIKKYHESRFEGHRNVCLIPTSAHGTNAASAAMVGMRVVVVECDSKGNVDVEDLKKKAEQNSKNLSAIMVTYPSTHGVFEERIKEICEIVHAHGGQVYMDGANMNAQVGITSPGSIGADVCHLNLHKTFCIPHGGGGPGMGPICVKSQLAPFLPSHSVIPVNPNQSSFVQISAAPWGSSSILPISWMYIRMMGGKGLRTATEVAILNANYMAKRLEPYYRVYYKGTNGFVAHEFIIDCAPFKKNADIQSEDIAKRLMDYGFHAPTQSFPIANTLMIEPTESESKEELDRYIDALISIRKEIEEIETGKADKKDNVLKNAPHTATHVMSDQWSHNYSREKAAYPLPYLKDFKFWPHVGRIDGPYGDKNLVCTCDPIDSYREKQE